MTCKKGDIVYWCENEGSGHYEVKWGLVDEIYYDKVAVDYLEPYECRYVQTEWMDPDEWVYLPEFEDKRWHKLPRNWSYEMRLEKVKWERRRDPGYEINIDDPKSLLRAYKDGYLVKSSTIFHGKIESVVTKDGYQVQKKYPMWQHYPCYTGVSHHKIRATYEEAKADVDAEIAEFTRQCSLTDEEWAMEQIEKDINRYCVGVGISKNDPRRVELKNYFVEMPKIFDVETRISGGHLQWKRIKNKKWLNVNL
jgi:hypothetical protein